MNRSTTCSPGRLAGGTRGRRARTRVGGRRHRRSDGRSRPRIRWMPGSRSACRVHGPSAGRDEDVRLSPASGQYRIKRLLATLGESGPGRARGQGSMCEPPLTAMVWPVTKAAASEQRNSRVPQRSSGVARPPEGDPGDAHGDHRVGGHRVGGRGVGEAGGDGVDPNAERAEFAGEHLGERDRRRLGGDVVRPSRAARRRSNPRSGSRSRRDPWRFMCGIAARHMKNMPLMLTSTIRRQTSTSMSSASVERTSW